MTTPKSAKDIIKGASRQRRHVKLNLAGHLVEQVDALEAELFDLQVEEDSKSDAAKKPQRLTDRSPLLEKAEQIKALQEQMADFWLEVVLEQKPFIEWRQWVETHPPRLPDAEGKGGDPTDEQLGYNFDALITEFVPGCVVEPELDAEDWAGILDKAAPGDLRDLGLRVVRMHTGRLNVPLSRIASDVIARQSGKYAPQELSESAPDDSTDGSP